VLPRENCDGSNAVNHPRRRREGIANRGPHAERTLPPPDTKEEIMLRPILVSLLLVLSAACAQVPKPQLQAYSEAFQAVQTAAGPMIADYAIGERAAAMAAMDAPIQARDEGGNLKFNAKGDPVMVDRNPNGYFADFRPTDTAALSTIGLPPGADAVDRALRGIAAYNDTLVALAEDRNVDEARGQLRSIVTEVGALIPGAEAATAVGQSLAGLVVDFLKPAVQQDNRAMFRQLVLDGHPKVISLIHLLRDQSTPQYAATIRNLSRKAQDEPNGSEAHKAAIEKIEAWQVVFADYVTLLTVMETRLDQLELAVRNPKSQPVLARAQAGAVELRSYADGLRRSIAQLRAKP
jgi:hypothetical protein